MTTPEHSSLAGIPIYLEAKGEEGAVMRQALGYLCWSTTLQWTTQEQDFPRALVAPVTRVAKEKSCRLVASARNYNLQIGA